MLLTSILFYLVSLLNASTLENPIIGVLSQETYIVNKAFPNYKAFIGASYVKLLESGGARVIPIWIGQNREYYENIVKYTNGILFPGGGTYFNETDGYGVAAQQLYELAIETNNNGIYYPIWGICLGMQVLAFSATGGIDVRSSCSAKNIPMSLNFTSDFHETKLFGKVPQSVKEALERSKLAFNNHRYCLTKNDLIEYNILDKWIISSTNEDSNGIEFISSMEHRNYPFYGIQFHVEKNVFEFKSTQNIPHGKAAVEVTQFFTNFFVNECRKNNNTFPTSEIEQSLLIYQFNPVYSGNAISYEQIYLFTDNDIRNNHITI